MIRHFTDKKDISKIIHFMGILEKSNCTKCSCNQTRVWFHCTGSSGVFPSTHVFAFRPIHKDLRCVRVRDVCHALSLVTSHERRPFKRQEQYFILTRCQEVSLQPLCLWTLFFFLCFYIFPLLKLIILLSFFIIITSQPPAVSKTIRCKLGVLSQ